MRSIAAHHQLMNWLVIHPITEAPTSRTGRASRVTLSLLMLLTCTCLLSLPLSTHAASTQAASTGFTGAYEREPIRATTPTTQAAAREGASTPSTPRKSSNIVEPTRVILALGIVLAIIFGLRWIGRRYFPAVTGGRATSAVRVLSRTPVAPKQQVLLLHVGRRVLVVADNGTQLNPLSEIAEADEVAQIIGQITSVSQTGLFESAFGKAQDGFTEVNVGTADETTSEPDDEHAAKPEDGSSENESIASAHGDIKGLMDKVRGLAEQLGRST